MDIDHTLTGRGRGREGRGREGRSNMIGERRRTGAEACAQAEVRLGVNLVL